MTGRRIVLDRSPLAFTSQGRLLIGMHVMAEGGLDELVAAVREMGGRIFVGVAVEGRLREAMLKDIDDLAWDSGSRFGAAYKQARRRRRP